MKGPKRDWNPDRLRDTGVSISRRKIGREIRRIRQGWKGRKVSHGMSPVATEASSHEGVTMCMHLDSVDIVISSNQMATSKHIKHGLPS